MTDFIIKNPKYKYTKDGLTIEGNVYQDNWIFSGDVFEIELEHLEDNLYITDNKIIYRVE